MVFLTMLVLYPYLNMEMSLNVLDLWVVLVIQTIL